jgi:hypothetical protein
LSKSIYKLPPGARDNRQDKQQINQKVWQKEDAEGATGGIKTLKYSHLHQEL